MARNHDKYDYAELAFLRDSDLYRAISTDAAATGKPIGQIAMLRLADYYADRRATPTTGPLPTITTPEPAAQVQKTLSPPRVSLPAPPALPKPPVVNQAAEEEPEDAGDPELNEEQIRANIAAFLAQQNSFTF